MTLNDPLYITGTHSTCVEEFPTHLSPLGNAKSTEITEQRRCRGIHWICGRPDLVRVRTGVLPAFHQGFAGRGRNSP